MFEKYQGGNKNEKDEKNKNFQKVCSSDDSICSGAGVHPASGQHICRGGGNGKGK